MPEVLQPMVLAESSIVTTRGKNSLEQQISGNDGMKSKDSLMEASVPIVSGGVEDM